MVQDTSTEVTVAAGKMRQDTLEEVQSFNDALLAVESVFGALIDATELGDGFQLVKNKDTLIGIPFIILDFKFADGDYSEFTAVKLVTADNKKVVIIDGSTGIYAQLKSLATRYNRFGGIAVKGGLTRSDYPYTDEKGKEVPATTYYLATS